MTAKQKLKELLQTDPELFQLLNAERWEELFDRLPIQTRSVLFDLLDTTMVDQDIIDKLQLRFGIMYGLKYSGDTVAVGAPDKNGVYAVRVVANQGMRGGSQLGFKSRKEAEVFASKFSGDIPDVYVMQSKTVVGYTWIKINTEFGQAYSTLEYVGKFRSADSTIRKVSKQIREIKDEIRSCNRKLEHPTQFREVKDAALNDNLNKIVTLHNTIVRQCGIDNIDIDNMEEVDSMVNKKTTSGTLMWSDQTYLPYYIPIAVGKDGVERLMNNVARKLNNITFEWSSVAYPDYNLISVSVKYITDYTSSEAINAIEQLKKEAETELVRLNDELTKVKNSI